MFYGHQYRLLLIWIGAIIRLANSQLCGLQCIIFRVGLLRSDANIGIIVQSLLLLGIIHAR